MTPKLPLKLVLPEAMVGIVSMVENALEHKFSSVRFTAPVFVADDTMKAVPDFDEMIRNSGIYNTEEQMALNRAAQVLPHAVTETLSKVISDLNRKKKI